MLLERAARMEAQEMLEVFRVLIISGARQVGKSTLAATQLGVEPVTCPPSTTPRSSTAQ